MSYHSYAALRRVTLGLSLICLLQFAIGSAFATTTESVFNRFKNRLVQVRIIDKATNSKTVLGSGFFIDKQGTIVTNYHVVSRVVFKPNDYRIEYVTEDNRVHNASLLNIDVIHDLALLNGDAHDTPSLHLREQAMEKGERIYTLGNPLDLGMTIVEGTYSGLTDDTMSERILLSGAINPGMSGGPSITQNGSIVGVNVATAGNSIGFLVPGKFLRKLLHAPRIGKNGDYMQVIRRQLLANQNTYINALLKKPFPTKHLGPYIVPGKIAGYLNCWGDSDDDHGPYTTADDFCSVKNDLFINEDISSGVIRYTNHLIQSNALNQIRFYGLMQAFYANPRSYLSGGEDDFTEFQCKSGFITHGSLRLKTAFCLRRYKAFAGVYDMVLQSASLNENHRGLITTLVLSGVSYKNAVAVSKAYLERLAWKPH